MRNPVSLLALAAIVGVSPVLADDQVDAIDKAVAGDHRTPEYVERDPYRHPAATLEFFEVEPGQVIVEIWPGGGWYTEVLAPIVSEDGKLYAAAFSDTAEGQPAYRARLNKALREKLASNEEVYGNVEITHLHIPGETDIAPAGSADRVLTFRNVHNFVMAGDGPAAFAAFYRALKPGGLLGVVDHRAKPDATMEDMQKSGYVTEALVKELAAEAGFEFVASSEVNANPRDTADHPRGVWTLPPTLRLGDENREKYEAIGESDRMTLKFRKPE
ncbi:MAG: methyltransferase [Gammaproteobacteria bacterium]|nr:methyltransferase [Gammaproteobacteria bacterium]